MIIFAFYTGTGRWRDTCIRWATGHREGWRWVPAECSHVEMLIIPKIKHGNLCISASKRDGKKVRKEVITWKPENWTFVDVPDLDGPDCLKRVEQFLGKPYDSLGAVMSITGWDVGFKGHWFCSEILGHGIRLRNPHRYHPEKFKQVLLDMGGIEYRIEEKAGQK